MRYSDLPGKSVVIWGAGREGIAAFEDLRRRGVPAEFVLTATVTAPEGLPAPVHIGSEALNRLLEADVIVKSPGIPHTADEYQTLRDRGVAITSLMDLWLGENSERVIGVTGTKGKSTTSALIHHLLQANGVRSTLAGNIGVPVTNDLSGDTDVAVTEISSYQAAELSTSPRLIVVTSLYPEHLTWHGDYEAYVRDKLSVVAHGPDTALYAEHDRELRAQITAHAHPDATLLRPSSLGITVTDQAVAWQGVGSVNLADMALRGPHNLANVALALAAVITYAPTLDRRKLLESLRTFTPLAHRLETVPSNDARTWVDDGLATAPEAVVAALEAFPGQQVTLIFGGGDRGLDYSVLIDYLRARPAEAAVRVIAVGPTGARLVPLLDATATRATLAESFAAALAEAPKVTAETGVILLSPGAPSFDEFADYEARSAVFRAAAANERD